MNVTKRIVLLIGFCLIFTSQADAQSFLNKLGKSIKETVENTVERNVVEKTEEVTEKALDVKANKKNGESTDDEESENESQDNSVQNTKQEPQQIDFPENFIVEFDIIPDEEFGYGIQFTLYQEREDDPK